MLNPRFLYNLTKIKIFYPKYCNIRPIHCGVCLRESKHKNNGPSPAIAGKYEILNESNMPIIQNTSEEREIDKYLILNDEYDGINLERGKNGVFEIEDLVDLLKRENSNSIFVATVSPKINFVQYICVVSGRSKRHVLALAEFVRKVYKKKCYKTDMIPKIEGKSSEEWMALDLGNIALHIFSEKTRKVYDLETLWAVGPEYDEQVNKKSSEVIELFENYSSLLKDLKPLG